MPTISYKPGEIVVTEGDVGDSAFLITRGNAEVIVGEGKKAKTVATLGEGEIFGEMCLIEPGVRSATVKAVTELECVVTRYEEFEESIEADPAQAALYMKTLVTRLRHMNQMMAQMDPKKRRFVDVFRDWQREEAAHWDQLSDEERQIRNMAFTMSGFYL